MKQVDKDGMMSTLKTGTADVTLFVGDKSHTISVNVVDSNSIELRELDIRIENDSIKIGDKINITSIGKDANGTLFGLDLSDIKFKIYNEDIVIFDKKGRLVVRNQGFTTIEYDYRGFSGEIGILVK